MKLSDFDKNLLKAKKVKRSRKNEVMLAGAYDTGWIAGSLIGF